MSSRSAQIVYCSFDRFPAAKGAAIHIDAFVRALGTQYSPVDLVTIPGSETDVPYWQANGVDHHTISAMGTNLIERIQEYRRGYIQWWRQRFGIPGIIVPVVHFRSIFEGYPVARHKSHFCRKIVYEVNGFPSIELKYRYPRLAEDHELIQKLRNQEQACLDAADLIVTVSRTNAALINSRGVSPERIRVIPNGVDLTTLPFRQPVEILQDAPLRMLYVGTGSSWQGVSVAIEALALYRRDAAAHLRIVGPIRKREKEHFLKLAMKLKVAQWVTVSDAVPRIALTDLYHTSDIVLAPLVACDRNLVQGCCPLKVIEALASGTNLIASDLPVVRELISNEQHALLVRPNSAKAIKDAMFRLREDRELAIRMSLAGRRHIEQSMTWQHATENLLDAYQSLLSN